MPRITRWLVKASLLYFVLALCTGIVLAIPSLSALSNWFPVYFHLLTFGWLTQLIFGIALWMFPKYTSQQPRGPAWLGWSAFACLNAGMFLRLVFEPLNASAPSPASGWMLVLAAVLQWLSGLCFAILAWPRIRER